MQQHSSSPESRTMIAKALRVATLRRFAGAAVLSLGVLGGRISVIDPALAPDTRTIAPG